jgi:tellurite resistance protein TerC
MTEIPFTHWIEAHISWLAFHFGLILLLAFEFAFSRIGLRRLHGEPRVRRQHRNAVAATVMWVAAALTLAAILFRTLGPSAATQFLAGYALEESLSIDNLFVFLLLFRLFRILPTWQPRVLFWGVLGAILLRGLFIAAGIGLLTRFHWISYLFALILLAAAIRLLVPSQAKADHTPETPPRWAQWISRIHPVSLRQEFFFVHENGRPMVTVLFLALLAIEAADIIFALDSIPAVLSITRNPFLAYTSNILAVMGLRSLFFLLAHALRQLSFLHFGLAAVLAFAALKMLAAGFLEIPPLPSLAIILVILAVTIAASLRVQSEKSVISD